MEKTIKQLETAIKNIKKELNEKGLSLPAIEKELKEISNVRDKLIVLKGELVDLAGRIKDK